MHNQEFFAGFYFNNFVGLKQKKAGDIFYYTNKVTVLV